MRRFIDLHLKKPEDGDAFREMLELGSRLGYKGLGIASSEKIGISIRKNASELGVDLIGRVDLRPKDKNELTSAIRRMRRRFEIIAVECYSKEVARQAAKDNRVDVLNFPSSLSYRKKIRFDSQEASLASEANCAYEINLSGVLGKGPMITSGLLAIMRDEIENAWRYEVPVVVSSGATRPMLMRDPRGLAAILGLFGMEKEESLDAVSINPWKLVETNRRKQGQGFVAPGVRAF